MAGRGRRRCGKRCSLKWNEHLFFRLEDNPAFGRQTQAPELKVLFEQTNPDELLRQLAPLFSGMLFPHAEDAQAVVSSCHQLLRPKLWPVILTQERNTCAAAVTSVRSPFTVCMQLSQWPQGCTSVSPK